jgi:hypothetical protein
MSLGIEGRYSSSIGKSKRLTSTAKINLILGDTEDSPIPGKNIIALPILQKIIKAENTKPVDRSTRFISSLFVDAILAP